MRAVLENVPVSKPRQDFRQFLLLKYFFEIASRDKIEFDLFG